MRASSARAGGTFSGKEREKKNRAEQMVRLRFLSCITCIFFCLLRLFSGFHEIVRLDSHCLSSPREKAEQGREKKNEKRKRQQWSTTCALFDFCVASFIRHSFKRRARKKEFSISRTDRSRRAVNKWLHYVLFLINTYWVVVSIP